ncbi:GbsR/MarR family transcriptional regulator [Amphibacillus sp. Q70]|uniref:GbsR/MarR family transcriptional regulator n=1 Tax=Amphibacillus sp. Q70 TaxID=3453416 RepID=UPI003F825C2F
MKDQEKSEEWLLYEEAIDQFIQMIAKNMNLYDIAPSVGRLYGKLYFNEEPMTLDDLRDALEMSKTSMSTGVRTLLEMKMVEPAFRKGVRKDLYQSEEDWYQSFTTLFGKRWRHYTEKNIEEAELTIAEIEQLSEQTNDQSLKNKIYSDIERLRYAQNYYRWLMRFIEVVESGKIFEFIPKEEV